jgi:protein-L-isoaspartate(D-aspartate) O-methyltransferase
LDNGNALLVEDVLATGAPAHAPYDVIFFNGTIGEMPDVMLEQLKDGGRAVGLLAGEHVGRAHLWRRSGKTIDCLSMFDADGQPLPGFARHQGFVF